jgi:hypothetical protein
LPPCWAMCTRCVCTTTQLLVQHQAEPHAPRPPNRP